MALRTAVPPIGYDGGMNTSELQRALDDHIVAGGADAAAPARNVLAKYGIDINAAENGVFLPANKLAPSPSGATVHQPMHSGNYYRTVNDLLTSATTRAEAIGAPAYLRQSLLGGGVRWL